MGECSNFECVNQTWGDKVRCSKCRHAKLYTCPACGSELTNSRALRCKDCADFIHNEQNKTRQKIPEIAERIRASKRRYHHRVKNAKKLSIS